MSVEVIEIKKSIFNANEIDADNLRKELKKKKVYLLNLMASPGAGKTTTLIKLINNLKKDYKIAVMEADIDSDVDAKKIEEGTGVKSIQLHTGGMCHLDAEMTKQGLDNLDLNLDLVILENVGNLVCPAEFDTGAIKNMMILSVPEGDDKPLKYPLMFEVCDIVCINKIDCLELFDFSLEKVEKNIHYRNPKSSIFPICAKDGRGIDELADHLRMEIENWRKENA